MNHRARERGAGPSQLLLVLGFLLLMGTPLGSAAPLQWTLAAAGALVLIRPALGAWRAQSAARGALAAGSALGQAADGRVVSLTDAQLAAHGLILGASGSGKSTTLLRVLCQRIESGHGVVAIDMKGSPAFAGVLAAAAAQAGRELRRFSLEGPALWNPLARGNPTQLKDLLIASERFSEPHYQRAAERYLQTALRVLDERLPDSAPALEEVVALLEPARLGAAARDLPGARAEVVADYLASLTPDQLSAVRGLGTRLALLTESGAGRFLSPHGAPGAPRIDLDAALDGGPVVLFSMNAGGYPKLAAQLGTMALQDLIGAAGRRLVPGSPRPPALLAVDEFSALGAEQVGALFARARESGVSVLLATQELADLDRAAPGLRDQVLGNTAVKIAHRQDVPSSAQVIAQMAGTETRWEVTEQLPRASLLDPAGRFARGGRTRRESEGFLVHPNEIKRLATGEAVVLSKVPRARVQTVRVWPPGAAPGGAREARAPRRDGPER